MADAARDHAAMLCLSALIYGRQLLHEILAILKYALLLCLGEAQGPIGNQ